MVCSISASFIRALYLKVVEIIKKKTGSRQKRLYQTDPVKYAGIHLDKYLT